MIFANTGITITCDGKKHLGACIGEENFKSVYVKRKVEDWIDEIKELARKARIQPHAAYVAFTQGIQHRSTLWRTISNIGEHNAFNFIACSFKIAVVI